ncbi:hypothetical protein EPN29_12135 [bacterium]|nr:MAG: hypothetical protein EPN29_12135 [bacterium]
MLLGLTLIVVAILSLAQTGISGAAAQSQPPTDWSFYVRTTNTTTLYNLGCNQGNADRNAGNVNSEVILDFGGQAYYNNGTYLTGSNAFVSYATIESLAENFALGYYYCTGSDFTSVVTIGIGTNNSAYHIDSAGGSAWAGVANTVKNWVSSNNYQSQVNVDGANDMEPSWDTYSATKSWVDAYTSAGGPAYEDYGSADGCPQTTHTNGGCNNGWTQDDVWYVSYGAAPALAAPEIYIQAQANQWGQIKLWKYMFFEGPLDEYDLNTGTFTASQAWTALGNAQSWSTYMYFSLEIHVAS